MCIAPNARTNPTIGEIRRDLKTSIVFAVGRLIDLSIIYIASVTQRIEPMRVCELDAGMPRYQVPKFQIIAAKRSARTTQIPKATG